MKKAKWRTCKITAALLTVLMLLSMVGELGVGLALPASAEETKNLTIREADPSTLDDYQTVLNLEGEDGSRYAGRLWSDKSVFAYGETVQLDELTDGTTGEIVNDSDFLHVYSVLGSSESIEENVPFDVMFVIDISGSMGNVSESTPGDFGSENLPIEKTVSALNTAIETLLRLSPESRFGITVYGTTAAVLLPLGKHEKGSSEFVSASKIEEQGGYTQGMHFTVTATVKDGGDEKTYYADNSGSTNNDTHEGNDPGGGKNNSINGTSGKTEGDGRSSDTPYHVGHITNPQAGLAAAMDQFITGNDETTWNAGGGGRVSPRPCHDPPDRRPGV